MTYALVINSTIQSEGRLPSSARRLDSGAWVLGLTTAPVALQQACGYFTVVDVARPADTPTHTYTRSITLPGGIPTVTWTQRAKTLEEVAADTANTNSFTLSANGQAQIDALEAAIAGLRVVVDQTNATINGNPAAAIKAVTRDVMTVARRTVRLARLQLGVLDSTDGT